MADRADVLVVGAGVVGLAAARALALAGRSVVVLERGLPGHEASEASAGMLAAQVESPGDPAQLAFGITARERHAALAQDCAAAGHPYPLTQNGIAVVALDEPRRDDLERQAAAQRDLGLEARWLSRVELIRRQPGIAREAKGALLLPKDGCVDNVALCAALAATAQQSGARIVRDEAQELLRLGSRVAGVRGGAGRYEAAAVVIAAGAWSGRMASLPREIPVEPVRGQMAETAWPRDEPANVLFGNHGYVVPREGRALLGSTMEKVGFDKATTESGLATIRRETAAILPALARPAYTRTWAGLRPMSPDGLPIIGRDPDLEGLFYATGHGRNGMLLGPITGEIIRDLVVRGETAHDLSAYSITRFAV